MRYCEKCHCLARQDRCPQCMTEELRTVEDADYCFLTVQDEMWAGMLAEILTDNGVPYQMIPTYGAGLAMKTGVMERQKIYVPYEKYDLAQRLFEEAFPAQPE